MLTITQRVLRVLRSQESSKSEETPAVGGESEESKVPGPGWSALPLSFLAGPPVV